MAQQLNIFQELTVQNSITNDQQDEKFDLYEPFSFIEYLNYARILDNSTENINNYKKYLTEWDDLNISTSNDETNTIRDQFITLFKDINENYTTVEEKRYLTTIDFNNEENLAIALPFFAKKIKEICIYYKQKRNNYLRDLNIVDARGSKSGVEAYIKNTIIDLFFGDQSSSNLSSSLSLSAMQDTLEVEIEEGYNIYNDIFDKDATKSISFYDSPTVLESIEIVQPEGTTTTTTTTTTTEPPEPSTTPPPELEPDEFFWVFNNDGSGGDVLAVFVESNPDAIINWGDDSSETLADNTITKHTYPGGSFTGLTFDNYSALNLFYSRGLGGDWGDGFGGTVDFSKLENIRNYWIGEHFADFINFNSLPTDMISIRHNSGVATYNTSELNITRLTSLQVLNLQGNDISGNVHSTIPSTLIVYNMDSNNLSGSLPTITTDYNNMGTYLLAFNSLSGDIPDLSDLGSSINNVNVTLSENSLSGVATDFAVNNKLKDFYVNNNNLTTAALDKILLEVDNAGRTSGTLDLRNNTGYPTGGASNANYINLTTSPKSWTVQI